MFKSTAMASQISNMSPIEYILDVLGSWVRNRLAGHYKKNGDGCQGR